MKKKAAILYTLAAVLLGILVGIPALRARCSIDATRSMLSAVAFASSQFHANSNTWPQSLGQLTRDPPYLDLKSETPMDPWGNPILYMPFNTKQDAGLYQLGCRRETRRQET